MAHSTTINKHSTTTMGKVVRIRPNIYVFVCEFDGCESEHRSIDSFLRHTESHFRSDSSVDTPIHTTTHVHSNFQPSTPTRSESFLTNGHHIPFNGYAPNHYTPYSEPTSPVEPHPIDIIAANPFTENNDDDFVYEIYEIVDLGYDPDGKKFPKALKLDSPPVKNKKSSKGPQSPQSPDQHFPCPFCFRKYKKEKALQRHKKKAHSNILAKFSQLKKSYKCLICNAKFAKDRQSEAEKHMKKHFRGQSKK